MTVAEGEVISFQRRGSRLSSIGERGQVTFRIVAGS